ncbi:hypothetical protein Pint_02775 [Pistacia integerrima]|uniref:Uncharacterized protein n=1 Tax=Pistacia integerrima TaxID=434235 RepID=A0ACC0ZPJ9_9ROSI|nr:hypothetical protein Pint_02775 [Pistacia integerrima]
MQPKSSPCVFLGYSQVQSAYKCLDLKTQKIYTSRHVIFDEPNTPTVSSSNSKTHTPPTPNTSLFFDAHVMHVSLSMSSALLPSSTTPEGVAAIDAVSSGNLLNYSSSSL